MLREQLNIHLMEIIKLLNFLTEKAIPEGVYVGRNYVNDITAIANDLKDTAAKEISDLLIRRVFEEKKATNKINVLYVIDSLIKRLGGRYCDFLIPYLFRIFEDSFIISNDNEKISLFKLYYAWKYFVDSSVLSQLNIRFNLYELKEFLLVNDPGLINRYDYYNEQERLRREQAITSSTGGKGSNMQESLLGQIEIEKSGGKTVSSNINVGKKDELNALFSDSSPEVSQLAEFSDDERENKFTGHKGGYSSNHSKGGVNKTAGSGKKINHDNNDNNFKLIKDIPIPKKTKKDRDTAPSNYQPPVKEINQTIPPINPNINNQLNTALFQKLMEEASNNPANLNISGFNMQNIQQLVTNPQMIQQLLANPKIQQFIRQQQQQLSRSSGWGPSVNSNISIDKTEREHEGGHRSSGHKGGVILNELTSFIENSNKKLNEGVPLFQAISSFFLQSIPNPLTQVLASSTELKTPLDLLKIKDFNDKDSYRKYLKVSVDSLYRDIKNSCSMCGFRTILHYKFVEHLNIHFHINYSKRNSQKKVLYRKESMSKGSWISSTSCTSTGVVNTNSTISAVLYYVNDIELLVNNNSTNQNQENIQENEKFLFPVDQKKQAKCSYCGEEFRKKFINKYHYWFYLSVVRVDNTEDLVHESCLDEYIASPCYDEFLNKKRIR
jgi:hypothetical protein